MIRPKIFKHTGNIETVGYFGWQGSNYQLLWGIREGYKNAGDILVNTALENPTPKNIDTLIFPIIFNYRHYLEIELKFCYYKKHKKFLNNSHNLNTLYNILKIDFFEQDKEVYGYMKYFGKKYNIDTELFLQDLVNEISEFDENSYSFRYMIDKNYNPIHKTPEFIDLLELQKQIGIVFDFFSVFELMENL